MQATGSCMLEKSQNIFKSYHTIPIVEMNDTVFKNVGIILNKSFKEQKKSRGNFNRSI